MSETLAEGGRGHVVGSANALGPGRTPEKQQMSTVCRDTE